MRHDLPFCGQNYASLSKIFAPDVLYLTTSLFCCVILYNNSAIAHPWLTSEALVDNHFLLGGKVASNVFNRV